jgi:hypothetical protein
MLLKNACSIHTPNGAVKVTLTIINAQGVSMILGRIELSIK